MPINCTFSQFPHLHGGNEYLFYLNSPIMLNIRIAKEKRRGT